MSRVRYTEEFKIEAVKQVTERGHPRCLSSLLEPVIRRLLTADPVEPAGLPGRGSARLSGAVSSCGWHCSTARDVAVSPRHRWRLALPAPRYPGRHAAPPG